MAKSKPLPEYIVDSPTALADCCADVADNSHVAFDTEFVGEETYIPELCLVQVATARALYIIDPYECGPLDSFWNLLVDPNRLAIVHAGREEVRICKLTVGKPPGNLFDVQIAAGLLGLGYPLGLAPLVQNTLKQKVNKGETLTDWRRRPLTEDQIRYAYDDVRYLIPVWRTFDKKLSQFGRLEWAKEEFADFVEQAVSERVEIERWRKLKGISSLSSRRLAVVREVFRWRQQSAHERNRPARSVLRDDLIVEIAKREPSNATEVMNFRGVHKNDASGIAAAVARAKTLAPSEYPEETERDSDPHAVSLVASLLSVVLADWCARNHLTTPLVATSSDVRSVVRSAANGEPLPADCALATGWRNTHVLPILQEVLAGQRALRVKSLHGDTPLEYGRARPSPST